MLAIHENIAELRRGQGMTQEDLAQRLRVHRNAVVGWETGGVIPRKRNLVEIARIFGCSVDRLFANPRQATSGVA